MVTHALGYMMYGCHVLNCMSYHEANGGLVIIRRGGHIVCISLYAYRERGREEKGRVLETANVLFLFFLLTLIKHIC